MNPSTVLLLGDITGKGCVGLRMLTAQLERLGHEVLALPTALISNIFRLGSHESLETTDYLLRTLDTWAKLGIGYSVMYVGYVTGSAQARALCGAMDEARSRGVQVIVDPILGDEGQMYRSVTPDQADAMRLLCGHADILTPNMTEACLLTGTLWQASFSCEALENMARSLGEGRRSVLITGAAIESGGRACVGLDAQSGGQICLPYEPVAGSHYGTGDRFTALLIDGLLRGRDLAQAADAAQQGVRAWILAGAHEKR